jgi:hypothetical protein
LSNICGAVFLACPHPRKEDDKVWEKISLILRLCVKTKAKHVSSSEIAAGLARDSMVFEQAFSQVPVLSLYETIESKTGRFSQRALVSPSDQHLL